MRMTGELESTDRDGELTAEPPRTGDPFDRQATRDASPAAATAGCRLGAVRTRRAELLERRAARLAQWIRADRMARGARGREQPIEHGEAFAPPVLRLRA